MRTTTQTQERPDRGEEQGSLQGESDGSAATPLQGSSWYDGDARNDFWSVSGNFIYRHHVEPRVKLDVPREESFPIPLKYIDVTRTTDTSLDVMLLLKISMTIGTFMEIENCQIRGQVSQYSPYWMKKLPDGYTLSGRETDKKTNDLHARLFLWPKIWNYVRCIETQREAKVGDRETKARQCFSDIHTLIRNMGLMVMTDAAPFGGCCFLI